MKLSNVALAAALLVGSSAVVAVDSAEAQTVRENQRRRQQQQQEQQQQQQQQQGQQQAAQAQAQGRQLSISRAEQTALAPLDTAIRAQDWAAAQAALPAAEAAAQGADARYFVARAKLQIALGTNNNQMQLQALEQLTVMPTLPAEELQPFLNKQAELAFAANDFPHAERVYQRLLELSPNDPRVLQNLAVVRTRMGNRAGAMQAVEQRIAAAEQAGQRASEEDYRRLLATAVAAGQAEAINRATSRLLTAYPTPVNWHDALVFLRQRLRPDGETNVDIYRLQRAAGAMNSANQYLELADALNRAGMVGEVKAVLDEGIARNTLQASNSDVRTLMQAATTRINEDRSSLSNLAAARSGTGRQARTTADALYGYGRYAEAAELYRLALQKGGEDASAVNLRLGAALALAGQRSEAEAAFRAVTGPRAEIANLWLLWLARRAV